MEGTVESPREWTSNTVDFPKPRGGMDIDDCAAGGGTQTGERRGLLQDHYLLASLEGDTTQMAQLAASAMGKPGTEAGHNFGLDQIADIHFAAALRARQARWTRHCGSSRPARFRW
jgi:hypothetical protein